MCWQIEGHWGKPDRNKKKSFQLYVNYVFKECTEKRDMYRFDVKSSLLGDGISVYTSPSLIAPHSAFSLSFLPPSFCVSLSRFFSFISIDLALEEG